MYCVCCYFRVDHLELRLNGTAILTKVIHYATLSTASHAWMVTLIAMPHQVTISGI